MRSKEIIARTIAAIKILMIREQSQSQ